jgi:hypothetical protein
MTNQFDWQEANDEYLATALAWLNLRLARVAEPECAATEIVGAPSPTPEESRLFLSRSRVESKRNGAPHSLAARNSPPGIDEQIGEAAAAMAAAEESAIPPALAILGRIFELSRFEQQVLLLCTARDLDTGIDERCAHAQADASRRYPTFALAMAAFDEPAWDVLSPDRPLRRWHLVEINQSASQSLTICVLRADERIVNYIKGLNYLDDRVARLISPSHLNAEAVELSQSQQGAVAFIKRGMEQAVSANCWPVIQLLGRDSASKQQVASQSANEFLRVLYRLPVDSLPSNHSELDTFIRLLQRETRLLPIALYVDAYEFEKSDAGHMSLLNRFLSGYDGLVFLDTREPLRNAGWESLNVKISRPGASEKHAAWMSGLDESFSNLAKQLSSQFNLDLATIRQVTATSNHDAASIWSACRAHLRPRLEGLAQHLEPRKAWDELDPRVEEQRDEVWSYLVLPETDKKVLLQLAAQVEHRFEVYEDWQVGRTLNRGLGISALFAGESGTGKTLAAEVLAKVLDLDLCRIDLSSVVSKYIGETEKNLRRLFDTAEDSGVVLLFDEADALFGKRSEVKDSHDRYANIEINYLLQRLEAYNGLAILATNLKGALDQAFMRRLRFIVNFPFPAPAERLKIWKKAFPAGIPIEKGLDFQRLAQLNVTGGNISSIAINAAFLAAGRASPSVTLPLVMEAARDEMRKLDKQFSEADFRVE